MPAEPQPAPTPSRPSNPPHTTVEEIAAAADATVVPAADGQHRMVTGVDLRAQSILDGDLFAALAGSTAHGASFAGDAIERGAVAIFTDSAGLEILQRQFPVLPVPVLVHDRPRTVLGDMSALVYGRPSEKMTVIGITGTSGKTTTAYLLEAALTAAGRRTGLIGTIETKIAGARVPSALTTPEAPQLHALFALMLERGLDTVVMEVSSHALSLGRVDGTVFSVAAFTNLSQDHLDFHGTLEDYFLAKSRLFTADSRVRSQSACVCVDDDWGRRMADVAASGGSDVITVSVTGSADWTVADWAPDPSGAQTFTLLGPGDTAAGTLQRRQRGARCRDLRGSWRGRSTGGGRNEGGRRTGTSAAHLPGSEFPGSGRLRPQTRRSRGSYRNLAQADHRQSRRRARSRGKPRHHETSADGRSRCQRR